KMTLMSLKPGIKRTLTGKDFRDYLIRLIRGGREMVFDIKVPIGGSVGWAAMEGLQANYDLMWDIFWSYYDPYIHVFERATRVIPVKTGVPFTVFGIDRTTGLQAFQRAYDPLAVGEPGEIVSIQLPQKNDGGRYTVFCSPFGVVVVEIHGDVFDIRMNMNV